MVKKKELIEYDRKLELEGYDNILEDVRSLIEKAQYRAYKTIDNLRVQTYWQIGERIVRGELEHGGRADYGKRLIENLAGDIGLSRRLLYDIVKFYKSYQIVQTVSAQLSWSHFVGLIYSAASALSCDAANIVKLRILMYLRHIYPFRHVTRKAWTFCRA